MQDILLTFCKYLIILGLGTLFLTAIFGYVLLLAYLISDFTQRTWRRLKRIIEKDKELEREYHKE
ncbi:MAG: hypothetical protein LBT10_04050 [Methanobrevibacter sp.]|jgi:hypothetical protein|nr:hypothetical protein [Methanobrevibacter sp.]